MYKGNGKVGNRVALFEHKGEKPHTGFITKPSGTVAHAQPDTSNLSGGGDKGNNSDKRYSFKRSAFDSLVGWLVHNYKWPECRHIVFTIPEDEYYSQIAGLDEREAEKYWQKQFKNCLELLRYHEIIQGGYSWVKERQKNGSLHWHFIHHGYMPFKEANKVWSDCIRKTNGPPAYSNCVRHRKGFAKLKDQSPDEVAAYFGRYFQDGKGEYFYTKAYRIEPLPAPITNGKVKLSQLEFDEMKGSEVSRMDHATIYKTDMNEYARIINQRTGDQEARPDFSKFSGGLRNIPSLHTKRTYPVHSLYMVNEMHQRLDHGRPTNQERGASDTRTERDQPGHHYNHNRKGTLPPQSPPI
jgi:hypothetical protein